MQRENTDWVAIARSLGHSKFISKQLAFEFSKTKSRCLLSDEKFLSFFRDVVDVDVDTCGHGCCSSQKVVGPNGWVEFSIGYDKDSSWRIVHGRLHGSSFENYPEWLACYRRHLKRSRRTPK